jgi:hypothetical protein
MTRDASMQSLNVKGLYPAGEGAGYAGGILSAGVDGIRIAEAVARDIAGHRRLGFDQAGARTETVGAASLAMPSNTKVCPDRP